MTIIASVGENNELGRGGDLCWHIRDDLRHFKELTMGHAVVMGRKTWESLPRKPLPGRTNIVVSSQGKSLVQALEEGGSDAFVIGGASIYAQALPLADRLELTRILASDPAADTFFPEINPDEWVETRRSETMTSPDGTAYRFVTLQRRK